MDISRAQGSGNYGRKKCASQKVWLKNNIYNARYNFLNFNSDKLSIHFGMNRKNYRNYLKNYNYSDTEIANLRSLRDKRRQETWAQATKRGGKIAGNKAIAAVEAVAAIAAVAAKPEVLESSEIYLRCLTLEIANECIARIQDQGIAINYDDMIFISFLLLR